MVLKMCTYKTKNLFKISANSIYSIEKMDKFRWMNTSAKKYSYSFFYCASKVVLNLLLAE